MFDPRSPYSRRRWHYESDRPLSAAQLVALGSLDARTAAILWLLVERHQSLIVSGPTDPTPGIGKTTTLNALLGFLPLGSTLVYTVGMYEDFEFVRDVPPETTCVLANEVSDHLVIYMWDDKAQTLLRLPQDGFAIATSCHADTIRDVLRMLTRDLRLAPEDVSRLGVVVNIGLVGSIWPPRRRFLSVNFLCPATQADGTPPAGSVAVQGIAGVRLLPLATWDAATDTFDPASEEALQTLAATIGMPLDEMRSAIDRRRVCLESAAKDRGLGIRALREAVDALVAEEQGA